MRHQRARRGPAAHARAAPVAISFARSGRHTIEVPTAPWTSSANASFAKEIDDQ